MAVDDLSRFMFKDNINDAIIELQLGGVENNKDLFCFLVDLLCKGLVIMFGEPGKTRLELEKLTEEDFHVIQRKMALTGIDVELYVKPNLDNEPASVNLREIEFLPNDAPLSDFVFRVTSSSFIYRIKFNIVHRV